AINGERRSGCRSTGRVLGTVLLARDDLIQIKGTIVEALAGGNYKVKGDNGMEFLAKIGGRMRRYHIRVIPGDRVTIAVSPYDPTHGLIVFRGGASSGRGSSPARRSRRRPRHPRACASRRAATASPPSPPSGSRARSRA